MKPLKENKLLKWVYAYFDLAYKLIGFFVILLILFFVFNLVVNGIMLGEKNTFSFDIFGLLWNNQWSPEKGISNALPLTLIALINVALLVLLFLALRRLVMFLKNVFEEKPFVEENGNHLKFIGTVIIIITLTSYLVKAFTLPIATDNVISGTTKFLIASATALASLINPYLFLGLLVVVIGEIILRGYKIKKENDLTV